MSKTRSFILASVAALAAGTTALGVNRWLELQTSHAAVPALAAPAQPITHVLVAVTDLPAGTAIRAEHLDWTPWPEAGVSGVFAVQGKKKIDQFIGAVLRNAFYKGEPVVEHRMVRPGDRGFLAAMLTPGMRAVSVPVDATSGIAGLVCPGDRVDLILTLIIKKPKNQLPRRASETVLSNVRVLAMDQRIDDQSGEPVLAKNATLELTAKQVEMVTVAADLGRLSMSLRSLARNDVSLNDRPECRRFTMDSEASALIGRRTVGRRPSITVTVMRGMDSQKKSFSGPAVRAAKPKRLLK